jgi:hypothetical protein
VSRYLHATELAPLPGVTNNVHDLAQIFLDSRWWGIAAGNLSIYHDFAEPTSLAATIADAAEAATDTIVVYLAAHGLIAPDGELVLATANTRTKWPQFTGLRYSWIREALLSSPVRRKVVVVDSCFSGRAIGAMAAAEAAIAGQVDIAGTYILASTAPNMLAAAPSGQRHTAFTGSLIKILRHGSATRPALLRLSDLYELVRKDLIRSGLPQPMQMGTNLVADLGLVRNVAIEPDAEHPGLRSAANASGASTGAGNASANATAGTEASRPGADVAILIAVRIADHDMHPNLDRVDAQIQLMDILAASAQQAGINLASALRHSLHGGEFLLFREGAGLAQGFPELIGNICARLSAANRSASRSHRLRLELAATHIESFQSSSTFPRDAARSTVHLLDTPRVRAASAGHEVDLVLIVSSALYAGELSAAVLSRRLAGQPDIVAAVPGSPGGPYHVLAVAG